jgi:hypothetical protein
MEPPRLYHVVVVNERTRMKYYLTVTPELHADASRIMSKGGPLGAHSRRMLEEATSTEPTTSEGVPWTPREYGVTGRR